ncbi:cobyric acid synthase [Hirschia litorea]|uniref:Cobyric acid synthase n=1 Tax=Hirschia litorea TaxID=1199156 RepID=A0ABW2IHV1_9PROT
MTKALMFQGTGSDVGKSVIVAGLCRVAKRRGKIVAPFKPQNMSNNAAACPNGGEIGRAQALQALAAGLEPHTDFNPVLLKPQSDTRAQVIVHGKAVQTSEAADYINTRDNLMGAVVESFQRLKSVYDLILVEGAGSPAEVNLRSRDIANMGFARKCGVPVCLIGDIDKGGVIASLIGTQNVISPDDSQMITSFIINKFRGDPALFNDGVEFIKEKTNWPCLGVIPWIKALSKLPAEDSVSEHKALPKGNQRIRIAAPILSRIANFDDADPLRLDPNVDFQWVPPGKAIPRDVDVIILFGTKSTIAEIDFIRNQGWDNDILSHARHKGHVIGICGGYQMLGHSVADLNGSDGPTGERRGLGLLDIETSMAESKRVCQVDGVCIQSNAHFQGYEIHAGKTTGKDCERPLFSINGRLEGAKNITGNVQGSYIHGIFASDDYRIGWIKNHLLQIQTGFNYRESVDAALEELADELERSLDIDTLFESAQPIGWNAQV